MAKAKYFLILAESSLELVPKKLWHHPSVAKVARRRGKKPSEMILDVSLHYHAMKNLSRREKRGRPDIVHFSLLLALNSPLNKAGMLETFIHTINDYVIFIRSDVRLPKNYNRFVGLMEQLLIEGRVPPDSEKPLLYVRNMSIEDLIENVGAKKVIMFSERGERIKLNKVPEIIKKEYAIVVGGFPHGDFEEETYEVADEVYSIFEEPLETWTVISRILCALETHNGLL